MGKRQVHIIPVRKPVSAALLVLTSALIIALLSYLSGRAYAAHFDPFVAVLTRSLSRDRLLATLMPVLAHILLFLPWGFLAFVLLDRPTWPRRRTYALTVLGAVLFALAIQLWQQFLPTRVTLRSDALANVLGAFAGAALGHMRKGVHVRFDY